VVLETHILGEFLEFKRLFELYKLYLYKVFFSNRKRKFSLMYIIYGGS